MRFFASRVALAAALVPAVAAADPTIPGSTTSVYGSFPNAYRPYILEFDTAGFLHGSSDNNATAGQVLHRIPPGGGAATAFSTTPIYDADGIICDRMGAFAATPGLMVVAYTDISSGAGIVGVLSSAGVLTPRIGPTALLNNNDAMAFDSQGRLYVNAYGAGTIVRVTANAPATFITLPATIGGAILATDPADRLWVSCSDGALRRYSTSGALEATIPVGGSYPALCYCPVAGVLPVGMYATNRQTGVLSRITPSDTLVTAGSGFSQNSYQFTFDSSGNLYTPDTETGIVYRTIRTCGRADVAGLGGSIGPDAQLTADDIILYLGSFFSGNLAIADIASLGGNPTPDGQLTPDDLIAFLSAFFAGCP